jgi:hypothetical protein
MRKPKGKRQLERHRLDGRIMLKLIIKKQDVRKWTGFTWLKIVYSGGLL